MPLGKAASHRRSIATVGLTLSCVLFVLAQASSADAALVYPGQGEAPFAAEGSAPGQLQKPRRAAVDFSTQDVFITDASGVVDVYSHSGGTTTYLTQFGGGVLKEPFGIAVDQDSGDVYVSDKGLAAIVRFSGDGAPVPTFSVDPTYVSPAPAATAVTPEQGLASFAAPIAIDPLSGDLIVADTAQDRVKRFSPTGAYLSSFDGSAGGGGSTFTGLLDLAVDQAGEILIVDSGTGNFKDIIELKTTSTVERYDSAGNHLATLEGIHSPGAVAVDASNRVTVASNDASYYLNQPLKISVFDPSGHLVGSGVLPETSTYGLTVAIAAGPGDQIYTITLKDPFYAQYGEVSARGFGPPSEVPGIATGGASAVTRNAATISAQIEPAGGDPIGSCEFEYTDGITAKTLPCAPGGPFSASSDVSASPAGLAPQTTYRYSVKANNGEALEGATRAFTTASAVLDLATGPATGLTPTTATLNGSFDPDGKTTEYFFEYGPDDEYGETTAKATASSGSVSAEIDGLAAYGTYHYRLVASNEIGTTTGRDLTFQTTPPDLPTISATEATGVSGSAATLRAQIGAGHGETVYRFQWGSDQTYGNTTAVGAPVGAEETAYGASSVLEGLTPGSVYHFRVVATNFSGVVNGPDRTFKTEGAPFVNDASASAVTQTSAQLGALVRPSLAATTYHFEYGASAAYGAATAEGGPVGADEADHPAGAALAGLAPGTTYHFRVVATNAIGVAVSPDQTFSTLAVPVAVPAPQPLKCKKGQVKRKGKCVKKRKPAKGKKRGPRHG